MLQIINQDNQSKVRREGGTSFFQLSSSQRIDTTQLLQCEGILLQVENASSASELIQWVRTHQNAQIALMPMFLPELLKDIPAALHTDGTFDELHIKGALSKTQKIRNRLQAMQWKNATLNSFQAETSLRLLRYMYSREVLLHPVASRQSKIGYHYPFLSASHNAQNDQECLQLIEKSITECYVKGAVADKIHTCHKCSSNYLNFRESCSHCGSIDLNTESIIHHFVCAHVAKESDFVKGDDLVCPKCDKHLRHIGIDYDKPSTIHTCNSCAHDSQQTEMKAKCIDCQGESALSELEEHTIHALELTETGVHRAIHGYENSIKTTTKSSMDLNVFQLLLKQEGARIQKTKGQSLFGKCSILDPNIAKLQSQMAEALDNELYTVLQKHLEAPEILIRESQFNYIFLLPECAWAEGQEKVSKMKLHIGELLQDNLNCPSENIYFQLQPVSQDSSLNDLTNERHTA